LGAIVARRSTEPYDAAGIGEDTVVEIIYTSGTTAEPKGVVLTHANLLANLRPLEREIGKYRKWVRVVRPLRFLNLLPLGHVFGQFMGVFVPPLLGGEVHFQSSLNPSEITETIRRERVSIVVTVPRVLEVLRDRVERAQAAGATGRAEKFRRALGAAGAWGVARRWWAFRRVRREFGWKFWAFVAGGATLPAATEDFWQRMGYAVVQGYGMTETASLISVNHPFKRSRGSIGKTLPGQEVRLDESGEIMVRGANVSRGYWSGDARPASDDEVNGGDGDDGWLRTGDLGELDAAGNLFFKGRKKDVIVTAAGLSRWPRSSCATTRRARV
jgi:long-chain acyl-CoA synthetase